MKKASRLLAMVMAVIMIMSAACLPIYAKNVSSDYTKPSVNSLEKYYFSAEQGCSYILDMLDEILAEADFNMTWGDMGLSGITKSAVKSATGIDRLNFSSIDASINTLYSLLYGIDHSSLVSFADFFGAFGNLLDKDVGLIQSYVYIDPTNTRASGAADLDVLYMIINWLANNENFLRKLVAGTLNFGLLKNALSGEIKTILTDFDGWLKLTIYKALVNGDATALPAGDTPVDDAVQQVVNWALINGTGETVETGANSILGANFKALLPAMGSDTIKAAGGANIKAVDIQADRGEGVKSYKMSFYQLISNAVDALMSGMLKDMLAGILFDALKIDTTANGGKGNTDVMSDTTFNLIVGAIEELFVQNGAPAVHYSADAATYPVPKINDLLDWLLTGSDGVDPALNTFISTSYGGINLTDNFMSLLNDIARMLPSLLPAFGLELDASLAYSASDLAATLAFNADREIVLSSAEDAETNLYLTFEKGADGERMRIYPTEYKLGETGEKIPTKYAYFSDNSLVNTIDKAESDYINSDLVRPEYYISDSQVYANLVKLLLSSFIKGTYFPEWTDSIASVGAYALASLAADIVPEGEYFDRLDAYYYNNTHSDSYVSPSTGKTIDKDHDLDYTVIKTNARDGKQIEIPYAVGEIGAAIGAFYLNGVFDVNDRPFTVLNSSLEQFGSEMLLWGFTKYMPIFTGTYNANTGYYEGQATWKNSVNSFIDQIYSDPAAGTYKANANFDAIYTLIDDTVFGLVPSSWLPETYVGSFDFINKWLLDSVQDFDLQQLFSLFSVNKSGELNESLLTVLLRTVDRVLAIVLGGNSVLLPARTNMYANGGIFAANNTTTITSLDALLDGSSESSSLAFFVTSLVRYLNQYKAELCTTIFPLLLSTKYVPEFDNGTNYLGADMSAYKVSRLQSYLDSFNVGVNATAILNTTDKAAADAAVKANANSYIYTRTLDGVDHYTVYQKLDFYTCATETSGIADDNTYTDGNGNVASDTTKSTFGSFGKAILNNRTANNGFVSYTTDAYRFSEAEDYVKLATFNNLESELKDAAKFVSGYKAFGSGDAATGYAEWMKFYINSNLKANNLYDANDDGVIVTDSSQATFDGDPGVPSKKYYPYFTTASQDISFYYKRTGKSVTVNMNDFNANAYEQIALAVAYGQDAANDVVLSSYEAEPVVRLAIKKYAGAADARVLAFDITPDTNGAYHNGAYQWSGLTNSELEAITTFCNSIDWTFTYDAAAGTYEIARPAFALISNLDFANGIATAPSATYSKDDSTFPLKVAKAMREGYIDYIYALYENRRDLYNHISYIGDRAESAESNRKGQTSIDVTVLEWLLKHTESAYTDSQTHLRNRKFAGTSTNGESNYVKVYTASSYADFKKAYDFATSLVAARYGTAAAAGLTQSMVSKAFHSLMDAFKHLVEYSGAADWYKLEQNMLLAKPFIENPDPYNETTGYTKESYDPLVESYNAAMALYNDKEAYDCEQQTDIDRVADDLYAKIFEIVYNSVTDLIVNPDSGANIVIKKIDPIIDGSGRKIFQGFITGLAEGVGLREDATAENTSISDSKYVKIIGMTVNDSKRMTFKVAESDYGYGTGSYYVANDSTRPMFFYYAVLYGDLNGDTRIDGTDKSMLDWYLNGNTSFLDQSQLEAADVDHSGSVDSIDASMIKDFYTLVNPDGITQLAD